MHYYREADEPLVRLTPHNLYGELKGFGTRSSLNKDQETAFRLEEFMKRRYEFRYNTVLGDLEYRQRDSIHFYFQPADQRVRSSIAMKVLKEGVRVWDRDITRFLSSDYVPLYNPIEEYLYNTGRWDGKDRIRALADLVPCHNPHWRELFYRWFLGMVAHWRGNRQTARQQYLAPARRFARLPQKYFLPYPIATGAAFRLHRQYRLQEQAGSGAQPWPLFF